MMTVLVWILILGFFYYAIGPFWLIACIVMIAWDKLDQLLKISEQKSFIGDFFWWGIRIGSLVVAVGSVYKFFNH